MNLGNITIILASHRIGNPHIKCKLTSKRERERGDNCPNQKRVRLCRQNTFVQHLYILKSLLVDNEITIYKIDYVMSPY